MKMARRTQYRSPGAIASLLGMPIAFAGYFMAIGDARADDYLIEIRQVLGNKVNSIMTRCSDEGRRLYRADMSLSLDGREEIVAITALCERGDISLKFRAGNDYLFIASQPYIRIPIGPSNSPEARASRKIELCEPPPRADEDWSDPLYRSPVLRWGQPLATIWVEIYPGR